MEMTGVFEADLSQVQQGIGMSINRAVRELMVEIGQSSPMIKGLDYRFVEGQLWLDMWTSEGESLPVARKVQDVLLLAQKEVSETLEVPFRIKDERAMERLESIVETLHTLHRRFGSNIASELAITIDRSIPSFKFAKPVEDTLPHDDMERLFETFIANYANVVKEASEEFSRLIDSSKSVKNVEYVSKSGEVLFSIELAYDGIELDYTYRQLRHWAEWTNDLIRVPTSGFESGVISITVPEGSWKKIEEGYEIQKKLHETFDVVSGKILEASVNSQKETSAKSSDKSRKI